MANEPINKPANDIIDISLSATKRKKFRIDGDDSRIIELNTSDVGIVGRFNECYKKLQDLQDKASHLMDGLDIDDEDITYETTSTVAERLKTVDAEMRNILDYLFDAPVSEVTAPDGSMYDPFNGDFRFNHIIEALITPYENNMKAEFDKMAREVKKHTRKYTKK